MLIFTRTKRGADKVAQVINRAGHRADSIHGDKTQGARSRALAGFKRGHTKVLVATDIAARGIDVDGITHVINYDLPDEAENYVHRIGRTGRAGAKGMALSFCDATERGTLRAIERITKSKIYVEMDHPFHSEAASQSRDEARKPGSYRGKRTGGFQRGGGGGGGRSPYPPRNDRNDRRDRNDRNDNAPRFNESSENRAPRRERFSEDAPKPRSRNFGDNQAPRPPRRGDRPRSSNYKEPT
jgi:ATP-dependent RNA helicase RhlE